MKATLQVAATVVMSLILNPLPSQRVFDDN